MMKTTTWTWAAVAVVCAALAGVGGAFALASGGEEKPPVPSPGTVPPLVLKDPQPKDKEKPTDEAWLGKDGKVPTAFPELAFEPDPNDKTGEKREAQFAKLCPRLTGKTALKIEPTDDTLRKLLKARLQQGIEEMMRIREIIRVGNWDPRFRPQVVECLTDMQATVFELWGNQPKELIPWLEELVVIAKEFERFHSIRIRLGTDPPQVYNAAVRHRLAVEAALVKAKRRA